MSKKKNKKFKKEKRAFAPAVETTNSAENIESVAQTTQAEPVPLKKEQSLDAKYAHVRKDVKKISLLIVLILLLLAGSFILEEKTTVLKSIGNWIYSIANIQAS